MDWLIWIMLLRVALTLHTVGAVRARSAGSVMGRSLVETAASVLTVYVSALAIHGLAAWIEPDVQKRMSFLSVAPEQLTLMILPLAWMAGATVTGATSERGRPVAQMLLAILASALAMALVVTSGVMSNQPRSSLHAMAVSLSLLAGGALAAIVAAMATGPRQGKYNRDQSANIIPGHSLTLHMVGTLLLIAMVPMFLVGLQFTLAPALGGRAFGSERWTCCSVRAPHWRPRFPGRRCATSPTPRGRSWPARCWV
jgi:ammonium transporter, Amt family